MKVMINSRTTNKKFFLNNIFKYADFMDRKIPLSILLKNNDYIFLTSIHF